MQVLVRDRARVRVRVRVRVVQVLVRDRARVRVGVGVEVRVGVGVGVSLGLEGCAGPRAGGGLSTQGLRAAAPSAPAPRPYPPVLLRAPWRAQRSVPKCGTRARGLGR